MFCSKCGKMIPEGSAFCPECGAPVQTGEVKAAEPEVVSEVKTEATAAVNEVKTEATAAVNEIKTEAVTTSAAVKPDDSVKTEGKKKKKNIGVIILSVVLALVLCLGATVGACFLFAKDKTENFIHLSFDKPKAYYSYVYNKNYEENKKLIPTDYFEKIKDQMDILNSSGHESVKVAIGDRGREYLKLASAYVDLDWVESAGFELASDVQIKNKAASAKGSISLNDQKIISGNFVVDLAKGVVAMQFPEISEKYISADFGDDYEAEEVEEALTKFQQLMDAYPDGDFYLKKLETYAGFFNDRIEEVEKSKDKIELDELSQECTTLTIVLKKKDIQAIYKQIIEDFTQDKDIEKMVRTFAELSEYGDDEEEIKQAADEAYQEFLKECEKLTSDEELEKFKVSKLTMVLYVDDKGKIVGTNVKIDSDDESKGAAVDYAYLKKDNKNELKYSVTSMGKTISVKGTGTTKDGILDGDYQMYVDKDQVLKFTISEFEVEGLKNGNLNGRFKIKAGKDVNVNDLTSKLGLSESSPAGVILAGLDLSLDMVVKMNGTDYSCQFGIQDGGVDIVRFYFAAGKDEAGAISIPDGCIDADKNIEEYLKTIKLDQVINALKSANVPEEYMESIYDMKDSLDEYIEHMK